MNSRLLHISLIVCIFICSIQVHGQRKRVPAGLAKYKYFQVPGKVKMDSGDPDGTVITLINMDSKQTEKTITVPPSGKFDLDLDFFKEYRITLKKDGYYPKDIDISTVIPRNVWEKDSVFPPFSIIVSLYKKVEGVKLSFEGAVVGKIYYSPNGKLDNFDSNVFIDDQAIQNEISNAVKSMVESKFNAKLAEALEYEKKHDLPNAFRVYGEALKIKPNDKFVIDKMKELAADMKAKGEFDRLIAAGDASVTNLLFAEAVQSFKGALKLIPNEPLAVSKLANAEKLLSLSLEKAKKDGEFNRLITEGDANVKQTKYAEGIINFKAALVIRPGDIPTLTRIADAEKLLAQAIEKAKKDTEFARLITEGDANVKQIKYAEGIANYKSALLIRPGDSSTLARMAEAEKLLAAAIEKAKQDAEFARLIVAGDANVKAVKYPEAITNFKDALKIRANDPGAVAKLAEAEKLLAAAIEKAKLNLTCA